MKLPTEQQCMDYFRQYCVPKNIVEHCLNVRKVAVFLAKKIQLSGIEVDIEFVNRMALLHDLFKTVTLSELKPNAFYNYNYSEEEIKMWKQLKDKFPNLYEGEIFYLIFKEEFPELAVALRDLSNQTEDKSWEETLVHYADGRVLQNEVVTLNKRINYLQKRYNLDLNYLEQKKKEMFEIEDKIMQVVNIFPENLAEEMVKNN
ncbi:MAG: HD domain-containing protein [Nanoarchaeota archaeon]